MSLWRTIGIIRSPITVVVHVEGGSIGQFVSVLSAQMHDLLDERPRPNEVGNTIASASPVVTPRVCNLVTRRRANAFLICPPVEQTPIRLAPPKGASAGAPSRRQRRLLEAISRPSQELPPPHRR